MSKPCNSDLTLSSKYLSSRCCFARGSPFCTGFICCSISSSTISNKLWRMLLKMIIFYTLKHSLLTRIHCRRRPPCNHRKCTSPAACDISPVVDSQRLSTASRIISFERSSQSSPTRITPAHPATLFQSTHACHITEMSAIFILILSVRLVDVIDKSVTICGYRLHNHVVSVQEKVPELTHSDWSTHLNRIPAAKP